MSEHRVDICPFCSGLTEEKKMEPDFEFHKIPNHPNDPRRMADISWAGITWTNPKVIDLGGIPVIVAGDDVGRLIGGIVNE